MLLRLILANKAFLNQPTKLTDILIFNSIILLSQVMYRWNFGMPTGQPKKAYIYGRRLNFKTWYLIFTKIIDFYLISKYFYFFLGYNHSNT